MTPVASPPGVWKRLRRNPVAMASAAVLLLMTLFAVFGPVIFDTDPRATSKDQFVPPSAAHPFGTDLNGRDVFSRVIEGAQVSLTVGLCGALVSFIIGTTYGLIAGYAGGKADAIMMRFIEVLYAVPRLIIIMVLVYVLDPHLKQFVSEFKAQHLAGYTRLFILIMALGLIEWLTMARIVRGQVLALKSQQFVTAARALGQSHAQILIRHLFPNLLGIVIVYLTLTIPAVILDESFLSFLGLGVQAPQASWGVLLHEGAQVINPVESYWWMLLFPAAAMSLTLLALNFLGDALRDVLDPRTRS